MFLFVSAKTVCELAKYKLIQAVVTAHPSSITVDDIDGMNFQCLDYFLTCKFFVQGVPEHFISRKNYYNMLQLLFNCDAINLSIYAWI